MVFAYFLVNESPSNLQGLSPDNDLRGDQDVFVPPNPPRPPPRPQPKRPVHPQSHHHKPQKHHHPSHHIAAPKPQIFKGRFQNSRKPFKPPNMGLSSSLFRGNAGNEMHQSFNISYKFI